MKRIAITGAAGQIAYSLLFRLGSGDLYGKNQPISLRLLELPQSQEALKGIAMELEDCAFPLLQEVYLTSDPKKAFEGVEAVFLVGAKPRSPGMERSDLLVENAKIFIEQGKALNAVANPTVKVLVVGNPCNTNALIAMRQAPNLDKRRFFAMTRLDQNRATALVARKAKVPISAVQNLTIWGNHSTTLVPDCSHATIEGRLATEVIADRKWIEEEFITSVQKRGAVVLAARGKSSAASAAHAAIESMRCLLQPTPKGNTFSVALLSDGNPYGIEEGLIYSFPCRCTGDGKVEIISDLFINGFLQEKLRISEAELIEERTFAESLL